MPSFQSALGGLFLTITHSCAEFAPRRRAATPDRHTAHNGLPLRQTAPFRVAPTLVGLCHLVFGIPETVFRIAVSRIGVSMALIFQ